MPQKNCSSVLLDHTSLLFYLFMITTQKAFHGNHLCSRGAPLRMKRIKSPLGRGKRHRRWGGLGAAEDPPRLPRQREVFSRLRATPEAVKKSNFRHGGLCFDRFFLKAGHRLSWVLGVSGHDFQFLFFLWNPFWGPNREEDTRLARAAQVATGAAWCCGRHTRRIHC